MRVTIISDASYCHTMKVAGYGYWIASGRGSNGGGDSVKRDVGSNIEAEMMSIVNAVWKGLQNGSILVGDSLLIQNDCLGAMDKLKMVQKVTTDGELEVLNYFRTLVRQKTLEVEFRHVKGHTQNAASRFVANRMCDKRAKLAMRSARVRKMKEELKEFIG